MGEIASHGQLRMSFLRWALVTVPLILLLGFASARLSGWGDGNRWFDALVKPAAMPPAWLFGLGWTLLQVLLGLALALVLNARGARWRGLAILSFVAQLVLSLLWWPMFFAAHQVTVALYLVAAAFLLSLAATILFARIRPAAGWLAVPYLAWLCLVGVLNWDIDRLNPDAATLAPDAPRTQISF